LNDKLLKLKVDNEDNSEDKKMQKVQDNIKEKEHKDEIKSLNNKISMIDASRN